MAIHDGHRERMRQQLKTSGMDSLSDVYYALPRGDTNELAHRLLSRFGTLANVLEAPESELLAVAGMGPRAAELLSMFVQMERRHLLCRAGSETILNTTHKCGNYLLPYFIGEREEVVYLLCLDAKCKVIDCTLVHRGAVNMAAISVRKIIKLALATNATTVVVAHNHPSGIALPSAEDRETTMRLKSALEAVDVHLADHIIVADGDFVSLADDGLL